MVSLNHAIGLRSNCDTIILRTEINKDGFVQYYGTARPRVQLQQDFSMFAAVANLPDANLYLSNNIRVKKVDNTFRSTGTDAFAFNFVAPLQMDTSLPVYLKIRWVGVNAGVAGNNAVKWDVYYNYTSDYADDVATHSRVGIGANPTPVVASEKTTTVTSTVPPLAEQSVTTTFTLDLSSVVTDRLNSNGDTVWVQIQRDTSVASDYSQSIYVSNITISFYKWREGSQQ